MFNLAQTAEQLDLRATLQQLGERSIRPAAAHGGRPSPEALAGIWSDLHGMGLTAPVGPDHGGQGSPDATTAMLIAEEIAYGDPGIGYELVSRAAAASMIENLGTPEQRDRFLPRLVTDREFVGGVGYFEGFGRGPTELASTASRRGGQWELTGSKIGVVHPAGPGVLVLVVADPESGQPAAFVVEPGAVGGLELTRDDAAIGKLGLDAAATGNIELAGAVVPDLARLAGEGLELHRSIAVLRLAIGAVCLGTARAALAYAADYANTREAFGAPIAQYQGVAFPLVEVDMELDSARLLIWRAAGEVQRAEDVDWIVTRTGEAVARCHRVALEAGRIGVNTLGGHGFIQDHPVEQWYRAAAMLAAIDFDPLESDCGVL